MHLNFAFMHHVYISFYAMVVDVRYASSDLILGITIFVYRGSPRGFELYIGIRMIRLEVRMRICRELFHV